MSYCWAQGSAGSDLNSQICKVGIVKILQNPTAGLTWHQLSMKLWDFWVDIVSTHPNIPGFSLNLIGI